jgi:toxin ParE1/3/4
LTPAHTPLRWSRRALVDLDRIAAGIASNSPLAAAAFAAAVRERVERLSGFPLLGRPGALPDTRELVVHRNYIVTYRLQAGEVQVLQVWHVARNLPRGGTR